MNQETKEKFYLSLATAFGIGNVRKAPGTFGSLVAFPFWSFFLIIFQALSLPYSLTYFVWIILIAVLFVFSVKASDFYSKATATEDASAIVIDEVLGQLIAIVLSYHWIALLVRHFGVSQKFIITACYLILVFLIFRIFDITKPSIIGRAENYFKGGLGVVMDDVLAGLFTALALNLFFYSIL